MGRLVTSLKPVANVPPYIIAMLQAGPPLLHLPRAVCTMLTRLCLYCGPSLLSQSLSTDGQAGDVTEASR
jgi:hypothetical protein